MLTKIDNLIIKPIKHVKNKTVLTIIIVTFRQFISLVCMLAVKIAFSSILVLFITQLDKLTLSGTSAGEFQILKLTMIIE